jgi:isoquinoline 1-oxidoreductase alpha subunit
MQLLINGTEHEVKDDPGAQLLWVLRDELGMTGTKYGCGAGICGSCTVHVDGVATRSCVTTAASVAGKEIRTIEGLAEGETLHPVQQAFVDAQVPQCGWCMSGQVMTAAAFLAETSAPDDDAIVEAMGNNYCRCGCYVRIFKAVKQAAGAMAQQEGSEVAA